MIRNGLSPPATKQARAFAKHTDESTSARRRCAPYFAKAHGPSFTAERVSPRWTCYGTKGCILQQPRPARGSV